MAHGINYIFRSLGRLSGFRIPLERLLALEINILNCAKLGCALWRTQMMPLVLKTELWACGWFRLLTREPRQIIIALENMRGSRALRYNTPPVIDEQWRLLCWCCWLLLPRRLHAQCNDIAFHNHIRMWCVVLCLWCGVCGVVFTRAC